MEERSSRGCSPVPFAVGDTSSGSPRRTWRPSPAAARGSSRSSSRARTSSASTAPGFPERARGHDLLGLAAAAGEAAGLHLVGADRAAVSDLGLHYQTSRYPDALASGTPGDWYTAEQAAGAVATASRIGELVASQCARLTTAGEEASEVDGP